MDLSSVMGSLPVPPTLTARRRAIYAFVFTKQNSLRHGGCCLLRATRLDSLERFPESLRLCRQKRIFDRLAGSAKIDGVHNGERAACAPHEAETEAEDCCRTKCTHGNLIPFSKAPTRPP